MLTAKDSHRPLVLLVGAVFEGYRGYLLDAVTSVADVWLLTESEPSAIVKSTVTGYSVVDVFDPEGLISVAEEINARRRADGVLSWDELKMASAAHLAQALELPGAEPSAIARCRDKHLTRTVLDAASIPQPESAVVSSLYEAEQAAAGIGYPVVLKPRALGASMGVIRADRPDGLASAYAHSRAAGVGPVAYQEDGVLVEEYIPGDEISVDSWVQGGRTHLVCVARKDTSFDPYFEEVGHLVDGREPVDDELHSLVSAAHTALRFDNGMTHIELRESRDGWKLIEVNCRLGGDLIPMLGLAATGVDAGVIATQLACGLTPTAHRPTRQLVAAVRFLYPPTPCTVGSVEIRRGDLPPEITLAEPVALPGTEIAPPPQGHVWGRYAAIVAVAGDDHAAAAALDRAADCFTLNLK